MSAAEYYNSQPSGASGAQKPTSPTSPVNKPDLQIPVFPPTHDGGYTGDLSYANTHYSAHSIDHAYDNHPPSKTESPYSENIQLQGGPQHQHQQQETGYPGPMSAFESDGEPPRRHSRKRKKPSWSRRYPWFCYLITTIQIGVFCGQLAKTSQVTGSVIAKDPFNYMIGPPADILINMGARYVPCMKLVEGINDQGIGMFGKKYMCPKRYENGQESNEVTSSDGIRYQEIGCSIQEVCGFNGNAMPETIDANHQPNQWWRFIVPIFLHVGVIHLLFNMVVQVILGGDMERRIGALRFGIVYFLSGIFGFILGGTVGGKGQVSVGASGAIFGIFALTLLDVFYTWNERLSPGKDLGFLILDMAISFVLGLLPFIDNFAHIGGFVAGLACGVVFLRTPKTIARRLGQDDPPYTKATSTNRYNSSTGDSDLSGFRGFFKNPVGFFKGRKTAWWLWWFVRAFVLTMILVGVIVMLDSFYKKDDVCKWCRFLNCLQVRDWCEMDDLKFTNTKTSANTARMLLGSTAGLRRHLRSAYNFHSPRFMAPKKSSNGNGNGSKKQDSKPQPTPNNTNATSRNQRGRPAPGTSADGNRISVKELVAGKSWTGKLPLNLLNEHCQKSGWGIPDYNTRKEKLGLFSCSVTLTTKNPKTRETETIFFRYPQNRPDGQPIPNVTTQTAVEARNVAATYALHRVCNMKNIHTALPPTHRALWGEFEAIRKEEVARGLAWKYEADPFAAIREKEAAATALRAAKEDGKSSRSGGSGGANRDKGWGKMPILDMSDRKRQEIEAMIRKYHIWNPMGKMLKQDEKAKIVADMVILGFREAHAEEAVQYVKDEQEALEWLLIHVPEDDIPPRFIPENYKAGISLQAGESLAMEYAAKRISKPGYSMDLCLETLQANAGDEKRSAEALMQVLMWGEQKTPKGPTEEDLISFDEPGENVWDEEQMIMESIYGEDRFYRTGKTCRILLQVPEHSADILPPKVYLEAMQPTTYNECEYYPDRIPTISISYEGEPKLPSQVKLSIIRQTALQALTLVGEHMLYDLVSWVEENIVRIVKNPGRLRDVAAAVTGSDELHEGANSNISERMRRRYVRGKRLVRQAGTPKSMELYEQQQARFKMPGQIKMTEKRQQLPAWKKMDEIVKALDHHQVTIVSGETGSGKSTQTVQFILDTMIQRKLGETANIICTQPRRISALGLADRVAEERCSAVGQEIGYAIRGESRRTLGVTKCMFMTTGVLLRRMQMGDRLEQVTHLVIDEVHERSLDTDFLLVLVKNIMVTNQEIRIILMSATLDADVFSDYFGGAMKVGRVHIEGRTFPVTDYYLDHVIRQTRFTGGGRFLSPGTIPSVDDESGANPTVGSIIRSLGDNINYNLITATVILIDRELGDQNGAILIFLPGTMEISRCLDAIRFAKESKKFHLLPLHASLPPTDQKKVFPPAPKGMRKIIAATNVAETSITIEDVVAVIDTGKVKETTYDPQNSVVKLTEVWASLAACKQRRGRAGRVRAGHCYKLFTRTAEVDKMPERPEPEMRRVPLEQTCLGVKAMDIKDVRGFLAAAPTPPSTSAVEIALKKLESMGAVIDNELTALGKHMSLIPADLRCAKLLIYGALFSALDSALTIAAILSTKSPFLTVPPDKRELLKSVKRAFEGKDHGDTIATLNAWNQYNTLCNTGVPIRDRRRWCEDNFLSIFTLNEITSNRYQLLSALRETGFVPPSTSGKNIPEQMNTSSTNIPLLRAILAGAFTPNIARIQLPDQKFAATQQGALAIDPEAKMIKYFTLDGRVFLHNSCTLFEAQSYPSDVAYLAYFDKFESNGKVHIRECTPVGIYALLMLGGRVEVDMNGRGITVDGWLRLRGWGRIGVLVKRIRAMLDDALEKMVERPEEMEMGQAMEVVAVVKGLIVGGGM
ncbi:hypothetical protein EX30DRAFT_349379 [Ascodesmis nigricans]|uniref:Uncharacterized protein n=1 Tax=Ascodesmis nigricans TaxID=341454 RepID=A0A4S2MVI8_9PEZI|nr:hypothetical protein EX30DRAFT_349379 [Ascodesmis nigricans]